MCASFFFLVFGSRTRACSLIKTTLANNVKELNAKIVSTLGDSKKDADKAVADMAACSGKGMALKGGKCVGAPWTVTSEDHACDTSSEGALT